MTGGQETDRDRGSALPGGLLRQAGPFAIFALVAAFLAWSWPRIPERLITHWNGSFEPDGFSTKSALLVFGIPALGLAMCALIPPIAWSLLRRPRTTGAETAGAEVDAARRRAIATLLLWIEYLLAVIFAILSMLPFAQTPDAARVLTVAVLVVAIGGPVGIVIVWLARYGAGLATRGAAARDPGEDRHWKLGVIYHNPDDPSLWVEKRIGIGYTFNFARPAAWWILAALIAVPMALTLILIGLI